jgi:protein-disulfide isomerase
MTNAGDSERMTKNQRREAAREKARQLRDAQRRKERRNRVFLQGGIIIGALAIVAVVAVVIVNSVRPAGPGPENMASGGIVLTSTTSALETGATPAGDDPVPTPEDAGGDAIEIQVYVDYLCPFCRQFEEANADQIGTWLDQGYVTYAVHPMGFLDRLSQGTRYSSRAANAAACVAEYAPDGFWDFNNAMYDNQPAENSPGLDDEAILDIMSGVGIDTSGDIEECVTDESFRNWVQQNTAFAQNSGAPGTDVEAVTSTPTVIVNGVQAPDQAVLDPTAFTQFVVSQGAVRDESPSPTPTPSETPAG